MPVVQVVPRVPETINFPEKEESILKLWKDINVFQTCLAQSKGKKEYTFYDGPPFATGMPHYGHILTGTVKDVMTRYAHQQGFHVERRFGWDCHGLPVEYEIDQALNIKGPDDVMKMGIGKYNAECRKIVMRYSEEWKIIMTRIGRWIDFDNDYKTMYPSFMESVWWVFHQLFIKGLIYKGHKVMPYSTACNTPLSNFESGQNYKDVVDPSVTVSFPLIDDDKFKASILVWTTTPWTLPSNLTSCVNPTLQYALFVHLPTKKRYIMLECRIESIFKPEDYKIVKTFPGAELEGLRYEPPYKYFYHFKDKAFRIFADNYVTAESGTGIVHQAPYFGEDDYRIALNAGIITKDSEMVCPIDSNGRFVDPVTDFKGMYIKDADKNIMADLKKRGLLVHQTQIKHSYPFCWRSDTPLIYRAVPSWFVRVEHMIKKLQEANSETYWVPDFVKEKRFGNWLRDARDWAISRNRYWGTPIPLWISEDGKECVCVKSIEDLAERTGHRASDLHRESIDHLEIPSAIPGNPPLRRVPEVFDCWFESGSMPYAQKHYPFEFSDEFEDYFPADFIAEGIDQTRGWFYTLLVIATALFGKAPFKNLIASGLILANDGQKMSKRKKNYPDPQEVVGKYGADALRLYLISSPVVRAENLRFKEEGVRDILKDVFLPWYNAFRFLFQNIENYVKEYDLEFYYSEGTFVVTNKMDQWIQSFTQSLLQYVRKEMSLYHLYTVVPRLTKYIDYLTNWYVRMNRKRLKGDSGFEDCKTSLLTLFEVLLNIVKMMSPFAPFLAEAMYQYLKELMSGPVDSVHYLMLPEPNQALINKDIERAVARMQSIIELGRVIRDRKTIPIKYPLPEVTIVHQDPQYIADILSLKEYILSELNVRTIHTTTDKSKYGITLRAEPDYKVLGARLKQELKAVTAEIQSLTDIEINDMVKVGHRIIAGQHVDISEVRLIFKSESVSTSQYEVNSDNDVLILLDVTPDQSMQDEGTAREIINRIQKLRKKAHLVPTDQISVFYEATGDIDRVAKLYSDFIEGSIKAKFRPVSEKLPTDSGIMVDLQKLKDCNLSLFLTKHDENAIIPNRPWANLELVDMEPVFNKGTSGTILLEVPKGPLSLERLHDEVFALFGVENFKLLKGDGKPISEEEIPSLSQRTIFVVPANRPNSPISVPQTAEGVPCSKVFNFTEQNVSGTILLENPKGSASLTDEEHKAIINEWVETAKKTD